MFDMQSLCNGSSDGDDDGVLFTVVLCIFERFANNDGILDESEESLYVAVFMLS